VSPLKYELDFISQKTAFFIVSAVKTSNLIYTVLFPHCLEVWAQLHAQAALSGERAVGVHWIGG
jgi:hypothetical protein